MNIPPAACAHGWTARTSIVIRTPTSGRLTYPSQRVEYFKGSKLIDTLLGSKYKGKLAKETPIKSRAEAAKLAQELLRLDFFHRSQRVAHAHSRRWELELLNGPFEEDGLYTWVYEGVYLIRDTARTGVVSHSIQLSVPLAWLMAECRCGVAALSAD